MIVQSKEISKQTSLIDLLGGSAKDQKGKRNDVFAQLLSSLGTSVKGKEVFEADEKKAPKGEIKKNFSVVVDSKAAQSSKTTDAPKVDKKILEILESTEEKKALPKELIDALSNDQVHSLIHKAKEYLKNSIVQKSSEVKADIKTMPKTLMGLVELADKMGIDMSEITLSTLDDTEKPLFKELPAALLTKSVIDLKGPTQTEIPEGIKGKEALVALMSDVKVPSGEAKQQKEIEKVSTQSLSSLLKGLDVSSSAASEATKEIVSKEQPKSPPSEHQKITLPVQTEALSALLRGINEGEKTEEKGIGKTADESPKGLHVSKPDSIEVKSKEAVQSMRHFAIDLKEAAESYKPPFTRVTMKLNPERLGEVEVTLIQRGNNVHVNIQSSNASSVAFLAHNATELKAQLAGQGITNATMNFMSGGESQHQNSQNQQQQQHNRFQAYESLQELESAQQELSALEIILPHYA